MRTLLLVLLVTGVVAAVGCGDDDDGGSGGSTSGSGGSGGEGGAGGSAATAGTAGSAGSLEPYSGAGGSAGGLEPADSGLPETVELVASGKSRLYQLDVSAAESEALKEGNTAFALDLYRELGAAAGSDGNLFFSPHSISVALAMTYAGARNNTEAQMAQALHFTLEQERLHQAFNELDLELSSRAEPAGSQQQGFVLHIVNAIWPQKDYPFLPDFLDVLAVHYGSALYALDFITDPEGSRLTINGWVADQTEGRIEDLIPEGLLDDATRMVLTNAIYFKAAWREAFEVGATRPGDFSRQDGSRMSVPMMDQTTDMSFAQGTGWKAVELPYELPEIGMVLIVPDDFAPFEADLSASVLADVTAELESALVHIRMPRFSFTSDFRLEEALKSLGMTDAFEWPTADFSGMTDAGMLFIDAVLHKTFIAVDETGTEAAASTAVIMADGGVVEVPEVKEMVVDRPFLFVIRDKPTGAILFLGRVLDPS